MGLYYGDEIKGYRIIIYDDERFGFEHKYETLDKLIENIPSHGEWIFQTLRSCTSSMDLKSKTYDSWMIDDKNKLK